VLIIICHFSGVTRSPPTWLAYWVCSKCSKCFSWFWINTSWPVSLLGRLGVYYNSTDDFFYDLVKWEWQGILKMIEACAINKSPFLLLWPTGRNWYVDLKIMSQGCDLCAIRLLLPSILLCCQNWWRLPPGINVIKYFMLVIY